MDYLQSTLLHDEKIIYATRPHWVVFAPAIFLAIFSFLILWFSPMLGFVDISIGQYRLHSVFASILGFVAIFSFIKAYLLYRFSEYGITDKRVLMKTGWISRQSLEIFLNKIEAVNIDQTMPGRFFNYGTIIIIGTGGTQDSFYNIPNPLNFRKMVQQQIDLYRGAN